MDPCVVVVLTFAQTNSVRTSDFKAAVYGPSALYIRRKRRCGQAFASSVAALYHGRLPTGLDSSTKAIGVEMSTVLMLYPGFPLVPDRASQCTFSARQVHRIRKRPRSTSASSLIHHPGSLIVIAIIYITDSFANLNICSTSLVQHVI